VLVQRGATAYTQDLAVPLAQILNDGATTYVYDHGSTRLLADDGSARMWYVGDALGSVRMTLDGAGAVQGTVGYDPWGTPQGDLLGAFGFTGALQDGASNLLYLRARWYDPGQSTFTSRDPFAGFPATPYSLHPYQYAYSNPALWTDPTGNYPIDPMLFGCIITNTCHEYQINKIIGFWTGVYDKSARGCFWMNDDGISDDDDVGDLWIDYICEFGPRDRVFGQNARLTKQLAQTKLIANMRAQFYLEGGVSLTSKKSSQMNPSGFMDAKFVDMARTGELITITDFLGGLDEWSVSREQSTTGADIVRFTIYNETTLTSGTRIGVSRDGIEDISLLEYRTNPARYNRDRSNKVSLYRFDYARFNLISALPEKLDRDPDKKGGWWYSEPGGGTMTQLFIWEEPYDPCYVPNLFHWDLPMPPLPI
jgi:RHS repeat-associated protein